MSDKPKVVEICENCYFYHSAWKRELSEELAHCAMHSTPGDDGKCECWKNKFKGHKP